MYLTHLECPRCGTEHPAEKVQNRCDCGSPLLARYDLAAVAASVPPEQFGLRPADLWRYRELLPVTDPRFVTTLGEGWTPLLRAPAYGAEIGIADLIVKDEGLTPTGSFTARGAAVGVSRARELGVERLAVASNGNAGAAWATYAARAGIDATVAMPRHAPGICRSECLAAGADLRLVDGLIGDAGRCVAALVAKGGGRIFDAGPLREPYRLEGTKTVGYEIIEQLAWQVPDVIICPTGGGAGLIGIDKALHELRELGWVEDRRPRLVAVQSSGCAPIVRAFAAGEPRARPWADPHTVAYGLAVPSPPGDELVLAALRESSGTAIAVDDAEILADLRDFAACEGLLLCPEGAACLSAGRHLRAGGWIRPGERVVVLNTAAGIRYPETVPGLPVR